VWNPCLNYSCVTDSTIYFFDTWSSHKLGADYALTYVLVKSELKLLYLKNNIDCENKNKIWLKKLQRHCNGAEKCAWWSFNSSGFWFNLSASMYFVMVASSIGCWNLNIIISLWNSDRTVFTTGCNIPHNHIKRTLFKNFTLNDNLKKIIKLLKIVFYL